MDHPDSDDAPAPPRRHKWIPVTALAAGTFLTLAPLVYLMRMRNHQRLSLNSLKTPPPRRIGSMSTPPTAMATSSPFSFIATEPALPSEADLPKGANWDDDDNWGVPPQPPDPNDNFNVATYLLKAFGTATLIVSSVAFAGVWGLRRYFEVDNMEDFAVQMRLAIVNRMPLYAARMRNALALPVESTPNSTVSTGAQQEWSWDDAQERLGDAYKKGGFTAWAETAAREVEEEAKLELEKREQFKSPKPK
ncbi:hypothetical protein R3P38DRAFT_2826633 [Favolaschia claudopus]|uniref:Uncharacterized protein n=1 Tax=Favolaschia claudopus TaxID=2862362 RepID=A0AAW0EJA8_9AGAR